MDISRIAGSMATGVANNSQTNIDKNIDFSEIINDNLNKVNDIQVQADNTTNAFISGQVDDLHTVMIATEEARLSLELAVQIRNKVVEAYKEINNMQL